MAALLAELQATSVAAFFRSARWSYAALNAGHIFSIALLIGSVVPLDLKLLGAWPSVRRNDLVRVLAPLAAVGLGLALITGGLLFSVRATHYADLRVFQLKIGLVAIATVSALVAHARHGALLDQGKSAALKAHAVLSLGFWIAALACGRLIAFV
ncbi:DUF2214 domain-containing protein [Amorphus orientalis]|uniref:DUF2214 domain-containing protein n=1 Tax=Amorphus orientalis TaxID=649198 RepID=A0AAE3VLN9_9HYPH|nr:DUF2214 domain-containing protein [Amorphus orientalis]MDQ0314258.1 hypothetical protein [Amorphus orientalis]